MQLYEREEKMYSWTRLHDRIRLKSASSMLANEDLLPSPPERQTWTVWNFFAYW